MEFIINSSIRLHILYGDFIKIVAFWDVIVCSVVDVSHVSASPVAAIFMVKLRL